MKKPAQIDWHKADVKAALEKKGWTFASLSRHLGYTSNALVNCLHITAPKAERLVAETIGVPVSTIWPSRYHLDGTPKSGRGERGRGRYKRQAERIAKPNDTSVKTGCNVNVQG